MENSGNGSKLMQMQARFQQRQMAEKEQKMVAMYEAQQARVLTRVTGSLTAASIPAAGANAAPHRQGKVRQMFEERRTKAGIDKSYPLLPIQSNGDRNAPRKPLPNGYVKVTLSKTKAVEKQPAAKPAVNNSHSIRKQRTPEAVVNGGGDVNHNTRPNITPTKPNNSWPDRTGKYEALDRLDGHGNVDHTNGVDNLENETFPEDMAKALTPRGQASPPPKATKAPPAEKRSPAVGKSPTKPPARPPRAAAAPARRSTNGNAVQDVNKPSARSEQAAPTAPTRGDMIKTGQQVSPSKGRITSAAGRVATATSSVQGAGEPCCNCGRRFAADRLQRHEEICKKSNVKKRKPYDALKHRLAGTEAEPFIKHIRKLPTLGKTVSSQQSKTSKPLNSTWRQKHEDFIRAIRAAKQVQSHLAAGGKLSDLPPPPPSENPDYVTCPHCNRRFNEAAAERHIPKCQGYQFNKAKPQPSRKR